MVKKTITYTDYNGVERTEDFYFNLTKAEVMEMEMSKKGGLAESIQRIVAAQDTPAIIAVFKKLVLDAYGERSADGREFLKEDANGYRLCNKFKQTEAYSILFMELATDDKAAAAFINGIVPPDMAKAAQEAQKAQNAANHPANN